MSLIENKKRPRGSTRIGARERILAAAERRLLEAGPAGLVLDAVARDAGVSKGGLLYHFASKDALVDGLIERMAAGFDAAQDALVAEDPGGAGCWTRAYLASTVTPDGRPADASAPLMAGILALVGRENERLAPLRERFLAWHERLTHDGVDPVRATVARLAADGLWLSELLGLPPIEEALRARVVAAISELAE